MHKCRGCDEPATRRCSGCTVPSAWFCSVKCQRAVWVFHIFECNTRKPVNTAYHLARAAHRDVFPEDPQTCEDYGFTKAFTAGNRSKLLGLYIGLIIYQNVEPKTIHTWRIQGTLIQNIKTTYEKVPQQYRGSYYPWFLQNQWVLDNTQAAPDLPLQLVARGWQYAGGSASATIEEIDAIKATWPESKRDCLVFCSCLLADWHPSPDQQTWLTFGFCACQEYTESRLALLYKKLMERCSFGELYAAYASSSLKALFYSKGLKAEFEDIPHLSDILEGSPTMSKSVWDLKQFVVAEAGTLIPSVGVDYGFFNCKDEMERAQLKHVYSQFFQNYEADPIKLHEAAIGGRTYEYIDTLVKLKKKDRKTIQRLVKNPYPLPEFD
ncbi:hypothetical protein JB92DRAFT_3148680 [Gautieria morchelliformis]|nr:hypothetical protein JB92DRAFT_3148680 [Gautieria morchelliformis]